MSCDLFEILKATGAVSGEKCLVEGTCARVDCSLAIVSEGVDRYIPTVEDLEQEMALRELESKQRN